MRRPWFNYKQEYIPHAYLELCIPATKDNDVSYEQTYYIFLYLLIIVKILHFFFILAHLYSLCVSPFQEKSERGKIEFKCYCSSSMMCTKLLTHTEKSFSSLIFLLKLCSTEWGLHESHDWFWKCNLNLHLE